MNSEFETDPSAKSIWDEANDAIREREHDAMPTPEPYESEPFMSARDMELAKWSECRNSACGRRVSKLSNYCPNCGTSRL